MRYQATHERAFYKALNELQKLRAQRGNVEIGFEALKLKTSAENRAVATLKIRKAEFEWKKERRPAAQPASQTRTPNCKGGTKSRASPSPFPQQSSSSLSRTHPKSALPHSEIRISPIPPFTSTFTVTFDVLYKSFSQWSPFFSNPVTFTLPMPPCAQRRKSPRL